MSDIEDDDGDARMKEFTKNLMEDSNMSSLMDRMFDSMNQREKAILELLNEKDRLNVPFSPDDVIQIVTRRDVAKFRKAISQGNNRTAILTYESNDDGFFGISTSALRVLVSDDDQKSKDCLQILIDEIGVDFLFQFKDSQGDSLLHMAAEDGAIESCRFLLEKGLSIEMRDKDMLTALHRSIISGRHEKTEKMSIDCAKLLIESGASVTAVDKDGNTALHFLAYSCQDEDECSLMQLCIDKGADLEAINHSGRTPLMEACYYVSLVQSVILTSSIRSLLELGADVHIRSVKEDASYQNITEPLVLAAQGCTDVIALLVAAGANVNARDKNGNTAMHLVAQNWYTMKWAIPCSSILLKKGINIDSQNYKGLTALHLAAANRDGQKLCRYLLSKGANTRLQDCNGNTALHLARHVEIVNLLLVFSSSS